MLTSRPALAWVHLIVGVAGLLAFLATGLYMDRSLAHLAGMPDAPRVLYRSGHIYLLFSALLNLLLGSYVRLCRGMWGRGFQYAGSLLLLGSVIMFLYGFAIETPPGLVERPVTREAIYLCLVGVIVHAIASFSVRAGADDSAKGTLPDGGTS
ncbi:MAG TPA: hypothetical protein VMK53_06310 [Gemmatimonadales bacterium]|nr:hypothetical protein [Gemmatimonadales bacterium]